MKKKKKGRIVETGNNNRNYDNNMKEQGNKTELKITAKKRKKQLTPEVPLANLLVGPWIH